MVCETYTTAGTGDTGNNMSININTQSNLKGTVEKTTGCGNLGGWLWHTSDGDMYYGCADTYPATYKDAMGNEQMALINADKTYVLLDQNRSGGIAELTVPISDVTIIRKKAGYTTQLAYPKDNTIFYVIVAVVLIMLYFALKR